jgi:hypothetical protein
MLPPTHAASNASSGKANADVGGGGVGREPFGRDCSIINMRAVVETGRMTSWIHILHHYAERRKQETSMDSRTDRQQASRSLMILPEMRASHDPVFASIAFALHASSGSFLLQSRVNAMHIKT